MIRKHDALMYSVIPIKERNINGVLMLPVVKAVKKHKVMPPIIVLNAGCANHEIPMFLYRMFLAARHGSIVEAKIIHFIHIVHSPSLLAVKSIFRYVIFQKLKVRMVGEHSHAMLCAEVIAARNVNDVIMHAIAEAIEEEEVMKATIVLHFGVSPNRATEELRRLFAIEHSGLIEVKLGDFVGHSVHPFCFC